MFKRFKNRNKTNNPDPNHESIPKWTFAERVVNGKPRVYYCSESMSVLARDFQVLLVSGYARRILERNTKWDILKTCIMFYNGLRYHVEIPRCPLIEDEVEAQCHPLSWSNCDATTFDVRRGPNYVDGQKMKSKPALYDIFRVECYKVPQKINGMWNYVHSDLAKDFCDEIKSYSVPSDCPYPLPPLVIINVMIPNYKPEMGGKRVDGPGYSLLVMCRLSDLLLAQLRELSADPESEVDGLQINPIKMALNFMKSDSTETDKVRERMKLIARIMNPKHAGFGFVVGKMIKKYNAKPFLARTSTTFYYEPGLYFGVDVDISTWSYAARKGLDSIWDQVINSIYDVAFVIEGRANHELPEQMLCSARLSKLGFDEVAMEPPPDLVERHLEHIKKQKEKENGDGNEEEKEAKK